ncbi:hypothetical protein R50072_36560 [Simiduia litorea]
MDGAVPIIYLSIVSSSALGVLVAIVLLPVLIFRARHVASKSVLASKVSLAFTIVALVLFLAFFNTIIGGPILGSLLTLALLLCIGTFKWCSSVAKYNKRL